jgi:hypothetical protein
MPSSLWLLIWLNFRAVLRRMGSQAKSPRGIIFLVIGVLLLALYVGSTAWSNTVVKRPDPSAALAIAPLGILVLCLMNLFISAGERAITFTPAEVDFLFPGPFTRRQLLLYKLIKTGLMGIASALIFAVALGRNGGTYVGRLVGIWLLFQFMQLFSMTVALVQTIVGERLISAAKRWIAIALGAAALIAVLQLVQLNHRLDWAVLRQTRETAAAHVVLAPFAVFARAILLPDWYPQRLLWTVVAAVIDLAMAVLVITLDADYLEVAATASAKRYDRIARMRRGGLAGMAKQTSAKRKIPMLPWLAGGGPVAWRQLTTAVRTSRTLLIIITGMAVFAGVMISRSTDENDSVGWVIGLSVWINLFLSQMLKFDFRGDLDHMDVLRSLPIRPTAVAAAQLVAPAAVLSIVQVLLLVTVAVVGPFPARYLIGAAFLVIPINVLAVGSDNLLFLLFPYRPTPAVAGDMGMVGRQTIVFACRFLLLLSVVGISGGFGWAAWWLTGHSWAAAGIAAWFPLAAAIVLIVWLLGVVFDRFDPSTSTPA